MRFIWIDTDKFPEQIPFLSGNYEAVEDSVDPDVVILKIKKVTPKLESQMKVLEGCGLLKIIMDEYDGFDVSMLVSFTKKVEKVKSSPMSLKVFFKNGTMVCLSENDLLSSLAFRKFLLREGRFAFISSKEWIPIVQAWLDMAIEVIETSDEENIVDNVLNYLANCVIYKDVEKCISRNTLFHDETNNGIVYCYIPVLVDAMNSQGKKDLNNRKLRSALSGYIDGDSVQKRIFRNRYRFWGFKIEKTEIDMEKQLYIDEDVEETSTHTQEHIDIDGNNGDIDGQDNKDIR